MVDLSKVWLGVGVQWSTSAVVNAVTITYGLIYCIGDPDNQTRYASVQVTDIGFGIGIGMSLGLVVLLGVNYTSAQEMPEALESFHDLDYALDVGALDLKALVGPFDAVRKAFPSRSAMTELGELLEKGAHVRDNYKFVAAYGDALVKDLQSTKLDMSRKRIIGVAVPGGGIGLQAYIGVKGTATKVLSWGAADMSKVSFVDV